jgi:hypothetical protein
MKDLNSKLGPVIENARQASDTPAEGKSIPPNMLAIGAGAVVLLVIAIIAFSALGNRGSNTVPTAEATQPSIIVEPTNAVPTQAAPTQAATEAAATEEPTPTFTFTPIPPVALGEDWGQDCVSTLWQPFPANYTPTQGNNGCWQSIRFFTASKGSLAFINSRSGIGNEEVFGLFAELPATGSVTVKVRLTDLTNVDILMGIFDEQNVTSDGLLITIPSGDPKKRLLVNKNPSDYKTLDKTGFLDQGNGYEVTFSFNASSASGVVEPNVYKFRSVPIGQPQKWLFLGFKGLRNTYRVEGMFVSLEKTP